MAKAKQDKREAWAGDCETDPFLYDRVPKPFLWGLYTGISYHQFETPEQFVEFVRDQDVIVYFHNGGKFDMFFLLQYINLEEELKVINGRLVSAKIGKCELRDSWNILPVPLKTFGQKLEIEYWKLEAEHRATHMKEISEYLRMDCVSLYDAVQGFELKYGRHLTLAGACMDDWKKTSGLKAPSSDKYFFQKFKQYYAGGRVSCFQKGHVNGPGIYVDMRSAYAWAMLSEHPYDVDYQERVYPKTISGTSFLTLDCVSEGALFWRDEKDRIRFPNDDKLRRYHVTGHEYIAAMETGSLSRVNVINAIDFVDLQKFDVYINKHYDERKAARVRDDVAQVAYSKLFMTNLYGKFCSNPENYGNYMCVDFDRMCDFEGYTFDGMIGPHALLKAPLESWQEHYLNVATGASVTGQVRARLWRAIHASKGAVYCDTDSLICQKAPELDIGEDLGQWNLEGTWDDAYIAGPKMYAIYGQFEKGKTEKTASKGVRLTADQIRRAALGETVTAQSDAPTFTLKGKKGVYFQKRNVKATA